MTRISDMAVPASPNGKDVLVPPSRQAWRIWLDGHPGRTEGIWVVYRKDRSDLEGPTYVDLVEEALCFGWIDSLTKRVDGDRTIQWYSPRRPGGIWARSNKERVHRLVTAGLMTGRGQLVVDAAKADGSWVKYDAVDALVIAGDLEAALDASPGARSAFDRLSDSVKRQHLWAVYSAKRPATRSARIEALVAQLVAAPGTKT